MRERNFTLAGADEFRFGFQNQEMDDEIKGEGNSVNFTTRIHDPRLGRFFNMDILTPSFPYYSPYLFAGNRVIDCSELEGMEPKPVIRGKDAAGKEGVAINKVIDNTVFTVTQYLTYHNGGKFTQPGYYTQDDYNFITKKRVHDVDKATHNFKTSHPLAAWSIGTADWNDHDISTSSSTFSTNIHIAGNDDASIQAQKEDGTRTNAFRHTFWQAMITRELGKDIAEQIGYAHEKIPNLDLVSPDQRVFVDSWDADNWVDLMNNRIGRDIIATGNFEGGKIAEDRWILAEQTLNYFHQNGLWVVVKTSSGYEAVKHRLSDEDYSRAMENLGKCDEFGYNEKDAEQYNPEANSDF